MVNADLFTLRRTAVLLGASMLSQEIVSTRIAAGADSSCRYRSIVCGTLSGRLNSYRTTCAMGFGRRRPDR